jgi:anti-sigma factor RsiW
MDHGRLRELAAGAALGDLEPSEQEALRAHAADCPRCRTLGSELDEVVVDLSLTVPQRVAPPALFGSVIAAIRDAPPVAAPSGAPPQVVFGEF